MYFIVDQSSWLVWQSHGTFRISWTMSEADQKIRYPLSFFGARRMLRWTLMKHLEFKQRHVKCIVNIHKLSLMDDPKTQSCLGNRYRLHECPMRKVWPLYQHRHWLCFWGRISSFPYYAFGLMFGISLSCYRKWWLSSNTPYRSRSPLTLRK